MSHNISKKESGVPLDIMDLPFLLAVSSMCETENSGCTATDAAT
jgi:hypothetical protein